MKKAWNAIIQGPWAYWTGAIVLGVLNVLVLIVRKSPWGVTTNVEAWAEWIGFKLGLVSEHSYNFSDLILLDGTYLNLGIVLGALWATLAASQWRFRPIREKKFFFSAFLGGVLMGYGARIAYGCNVGGLLNGIASQSLTGWFFAISVLIGTWIGVKILIKFLV